MKSSKPCPICQCEMEAEVSTTHTDYYCRSQIDHSYSERMIKQESVKIKIRLSEEGRSLFIKINYDTNLSEIWANANSMADRIKIPTLIEVDLSDVEKLKQKIKTYLTFA